MSSILLDVFLRVILGLVLTVGAYFLTRFLLARFALPLLARSRPTWALPVEHSRLPMLTSNMSLPRCPSLGCARFSGR